MEVIKTSLPCANTIGEATHMSDTDIREINSLYKVKKASLNSFQVMSLVHWTKEPKMHK